MNLKDNLIAFLFFLIPLLIYFQNPVHRFELNQKLFSADCRVVDYEISSLKSDDVVSKCENYDKYYAEAKYKHYKELASDYEQCTIKHFLGDYHNVCGTLDEVKLKAFENAEIDAKNKCFSEYNSENAMFLTGNTNCNIDKKFDFIVFNNEDTIFPKIITKGQVSVVNGRFKKVVNLGERFDYFNNYKVLFK
jgi:hypothetical protein